jgi:dephospho-CoA kinase
VIGVLGGIASGKSLAARMLAGSDGELIDADELARAELDSPAGREFVARRFGPALVAPDGSPDRAKLAELAFGDRGGRARADLEGWIHPRVRARIWARLEDAARAGRRAVLDVPLLLENDQAHGLARRCTALVFVDADAALRARRAEQARGWRPGELARREAAQMPLAAKRARAAFVLDNHGSPADLERQVASALARILGGAPHGPPT